MSCELCDMMEHRKLHIVEPMKNFGGYDQFIVTLKPLTPKEIVDAFQDIKETMMKLEDKKK